MGFDKHVVSRRSEGEFDYYLLGTSFGSMEVIKRAEIRSQGHFWNDPTTSGDHIKRLIYYRTVEGSPLIALVGQSKRAIYKESSSALRAYYGIGGILSIVVIVVVGIGAARERRLNEMTSRIRQARQDLQRSDERYRPVEGAVE